MTLPFSSMICWCAIGDTDSLLLTHDFALLVDDLLVCSYKVQMVSLEALFAQACALRAQSIGVSTTMVCRHCPSHLGNSALCPLLNRTVWQISHVSATRHRCFCTTKNTAWGCNWSCARSAPWHCLSMSAWVVHRRLAMHAVCPE